MHTNFFKRIILLLSFSLLTIISEAQTIDFENYTPLSSSGALPDEFTSTSTEKYQDNKKSISNSDNRTERKAKDEFYLQSTFAIDEMLRSGKVLYNDIAGKYVNKVFEKVIEAAGIEKDKIKIFVVKTNQANAFAYDQGVIFITTGLLTKLESEAQLAFVLCHEIVHCKKKHAIDVYVQAKKTEKSFKSIREKEMSIFSQAAYSKEKEFEADREGIEIFLKTGYNPEAAISVFDVLHYSYRPFANDSFDTKFFSRDIFYWPNCLTLERTSSEREKESISDTLSTHPNTDKRKDAISDKAKGEGRNYLVSEEDFFLIQKICRFEYCRNAVLERDYCDAIYAAYSMLIDYPENKYLRSIIAKSLYSMASYYNQGYKDELYLNFNRNEGASQQVYFFFNKLHAYEMSTLAINYLWNFLGKYPEEKTIAKMFDQLVYWQAYLHYPTIDTSSIAYTDSMLKDITGYSILKKTRKSETDQIDLVDGQPRIVLLAGAPCDNERRILRNRVAFNKLFEDEDFKARYIKIMDSAKEVKENVKNIYSKKKLDHKLTNDRVAKGEENVNFIYDYHTHKAVLNWEQKMARKKIKRQYSGMFSNKLAKAEGEKIVFLNPIFYAIDERKKIPIKYEASEKTREIFIDRITQSAEAAKVPYELISESHLTVNDVNLLNRMAILKEWIDEKLDHSPVDVIPSDQDRIDSLSNSLKSRYLCLAGNISATLNKEHIGQAILFSIMIPVYSWPFTVAYMLSKNIETYYFMLVLDLHTGQTVAGEFNYLKSRNHEDISLATFYDFMLKTKLYQLEAK